MAYVPLLVCVVGLAWSIYMDSAWAVAFGVALVLWSGIAGMILITDAVNMVTGKPMGWHWGGNRTEDRRRTGRRGQR